MKKIKLLSPEEAKNEHFAPFMDESGTSGSSGTSGTSGCKILQKCANNQIVTCSGITMCKTESEWIAGESYLKEVVCNEYVDGVLEEVAYSCDNSKVDSGSSHARAIAACKGKSVGSSCTWWDVISWQQGNCRREIDWLGTGNIICTVPS